MDPLTAEEVDQRQIALTAACILSWDGVLASGAPFPCNTKNAVQLLATAPWLRRQLETAMGDTERFFAASSGS